MHSHIGFQSNRIFSTTAPAINPTSNPEIPAFDPKTPPVTDAVAVRARFPTYCLITAFAKLIPAVRNVSSIIWKINSSVISDGGLKIILMNLPVAWQVI